MRLKTHIIDEAKKVEYMLQRLKPDIQKVLKRDCDIEVNIDEYDWVILVGSDALKYFTKITSVTEYSGKKIEGKF